MMSHMLDYQLFGMNASGHHLMNVLFHTGNTLLLFLAFRMMTGAFWRSAAVAFLCDASLHVESVAWVSERKDVLNLFMLPLVDCLSAMPKNKGRKVSSRISFFFYSGPPVESDGCDLFLFYSCFWITWP